MRGPRTMISLGAACGVAYQTRKRYPHAEAFPLDWLITPWASAHALVGGGWAALWDEATLDYRGAPFVSSGIAPVLMPHDFREGGAKHDENWERSLDRARSRFGYLAAKAERVLAGGAGPVRFVRYNGEVGLADQSCLRRITVVEANRFCAMLDRRHPELDFDLIMVSALEYGGGETDPRIRRFEAPYTDATEWPEPDDQWRGASAAWTPIWDELDALDAANSVREIRHA